MEMYSLNRRRAFAVVVAAVSALNCMGQSPDPGRFVVWAGHDVAAAVRGMATRNALFAAAGMGCVVIVLHPRDAYFTRRINEFTAGAPKLSRKVVDEVGNVKLVRPLALAFFLGTLVSGDRYLQDAAFTSVEAVVIANLITGALKGVAGRARPWQGKGASSFNIFSGDTSFPSGHATTVFALTTPWLIYYRSVPSVLLFTLGVGTSIVRMSHNVHWLSDVIVGSAIGMGTGYLLSRRHRSGISMAPLLTMGEGAGMRITWTWGRH